MNCATIDTILDEHRTATLAQAERQAVAVHLEACARCTDSWAAHEALAGEDMGQPPPELLARVQRLAADAAMQPRSRYRRASALLAAAAVIVTAAVLVARPWVTTPEPTSGTPVAAVPVAQAFVAGRDYQLLARPAVPAAAGKVAVVEFFMWPCVHCYAFEPDLESWAAGVADAVALSRVPVAFNPQAQLLARAFYTADALGKVDAMHPAFYEEIHARGNSLSSREALATLFARFDIDAATFDATFDSPAVDARVREAAALAREYQISSVPTLVVAGRYSTNPTLAGTRMLPVVDELVAEERRAAACAAASVTARSSENSAYCALRNRR